jgi:glycosyltransferase involved in cell wall biosynthesis
MSEKNLKVTIIMATYNRAHLIEDALQSIKNQSHQDWECLIIDDGCTDNTSEVISTFLQEDNRFKFLKRPRTFKKGLPGCRNYGLEIATGKYIIFFDDDDIVHPQNMELCLEAFQKKKIDFCVYKKRSFLSAFQPITFKKEVIYFSNFISKNDIGAIVTNKISIASCTVMWEKTCFDNEKFNENLMYAEEWECYPRLISNDKLGICINNTLYFNRKHPVSNTGEYYTKNPIRIDSKKQAINLLVNNLTNKELLTPMLHKYFAGLAIAFRDKALLADILNISKTSSKNKLYLKLKYYMFPLWKIYKNRLKTANNYE